MPNVSFSITSPRGDVIPLRTSADQAGAFGLLDETEGFGLAARDVKIAGSVGNGGRVRGVRVPPRPATLTTLTEPSAGSDLLTNFRRLAAAVRSVEGLPMPKLVATFSPTEVYELPFLYESGAESPTRFSDSIRADLGVVFPDPFWTARDAVQFTVRKSDGVGLLPDLAALQISSSTASGEVTISNKGEVPAFATWRIVGPASTASASIDGRGWSLGPIGDGEVVIVDTKAKTIRLASPPAGTDPNVYDRADLAPKFFPIPAGETVVDVALEDAGERALVTCYFRPRIEVIV